MEQRTLKPLAVGQIPAFIDTQRLSEDVSRLRQMALDEGADEAAIISAKAVVFSPEVKARADADDGNPSIHWPLNYPKDDIREAVNAYQAGVFFQLHADQDMPDYGGGPIQDENHKNLFFKVADIVSRIESAAFYLGYHLVIGLTSGNCKSIFCADEKRCRALIKGQKCRQPYKGRPSLPAAGIDALKMAQNLNFTLPAGKTGLIAAGLVMIA
jgi:predicted metal-binding protein